jgi:hypothetical protein
VGDELADKPYGDKTDEDKALLEVYTTFKRIQLCFEGGSPTKKARAY